MVIWLDVYPAGAAISPPDDELLEVGGCVVVVAGGCVVGVVVGGLVVGVVVGGSVVGVVEAGGCVDGVVELGGCVVVVVVDPPVETVTETVTAPTTGWGSDMPLVDPSGATASP